MGRGRVHLVRLRPLLADADRVAIVVGFASAGWLGPPEGRGPDIGCLTYRALAHIEGRGRVVLDARVRSWLAAPTRQGL